MTETISSPKAKGMSGPLIHTGMPFTLLFQGKNIPQVLLVNTDMVPHPGCTSGAVLLKEVHFSCGVM